MPSETERLTSGTVSARPAVHASFPRLTLSAFQSTTQELHACERTRRSRFCLPTIASRGRQADLSAGAASVRRKSSAMRSLTCYLLFDYETPRCFKRPKRGVLHSKFEDPRDSNP